MKRLATHSVTMLAFACLVFASQVQAATFTFNGDFTQDDNVRLFSFSVNNSSPVTLRTTSTAGGGFDTILTLFSTSGAFLRENDGPAGSFVPNDAMIQLALAPATYTLALTEFDNFHLTGPGGQLSDGFERVGEGNFTAGQFGSNPADVSFIDVTGAQRTASFSVVLENVSAASAVPEPASMAMFLLGAALVSGLSRRWTKNPI